MTRYVNRFDHSPDDPEIVECYHCGRQLEIGTDDAWKLIDDDGEEHWVCDNCKKDYHECVRCGNLYDNLGKTAKDGQDYCEFCYDVVRAAGTWRFKILCSLQVLALFFNRLHRYLMPELLLYIVFIVLFA